MDEIEKLKKLLHHWQEHNNEHAEVYREWAEKLSFLGKGDSAKELERLYRETKNMNALFEEALRKLE